MKRLFGTDGFRGVANEDLDVVSALKMGMAISTYFKDVDGPILIARDTRISGETLEFALTAGVNAVGKDVISCGVLTTPALAILTKLRNTVGIMISASHNPPEYNGIKVMKKGYKLPDDEEERIEDIFFSERFDLSKWSFGRRRSSEDLKYEYFDHIERVVMKGRNLDGMRLSVDLAHGATISTVPEFLERMKADVEKFNLDPDGMRINVGCGSTNPEFLIRAMDKVRIGGTFDGDGDRCIMVVDGKIMDGDAIILLNAIKMKNEGVLKKNTVVFTVMTNLGIERRLKELGIDVVRTRVGDRYILNEMLKNGYNLGGEQSGHVIFLDQAPTGDGLITFLNTVLILKDDPNIIDEVSKIELFPQVRKNVKVSDKVKLVERMEKDERFERIKDSINGKGRMVLRPSGTEDVVRIMVEHEEENVAREIMDEILELVKDLDE